MWLLLQLLLQLLRTTTTTTTAADAATATTTTTARHDIYIVICSVHYASAQSRHTTLWQNAWWWIYRQAPFKNKHRTMYIVLNILVTKTRSCRWWNRSATDPVFGNARCIAHQTIAGFASVALITHTFTAVTTASAWTLTACHTHITHVSHQVTKAWSSAKQVVTLHQYEILNALHLQRSGVW